MANEMLSHFITAKEERNVELGKAGHQTPAPEESASPAPSQTLNETVPPQRADGGEAEVSAEETQPAPAAAASRAKPEEAKASSASAAPGTAAQGETAPRPYVESHMRGRPVVSEKTARMSLAMDPALKERFRVFCAVHHISASSVIDQLLRAYLAEKDNQ